MRKGFKIYIIGSIVTILVVVWLLADRHPVLAADVIVLSPFPCPPGLPC